MMALDQSAGESKRKRARVSLGESLDGSPKAPIGAFGGSNSALADQRAPTDDVRVKVSARACASFIACTRCII
jgi:hypothetical protein